MIKRYYKVNVSKFFTFSTRGDVRTHAQSNIQDLKTVARSNFFALRVIVNWSSLSKDVDAPIFSRRNHGPYSFQLKDD